MPDMASESPMIHSDLSISKEFIAEGIKQFSKKKRNGGPQTRKERELRRKEVFRLHFDLGYSAVKISDLMKVNRNTINDDIRILYGKLGESFTNYTVEAAAMKQIYRFEMQRSRLLEELKSLTDLKDRLVIEKFIFEIDNRILQMIAKIQNNSEHVLNSAINTANAWAKKNNSKMSLMSSREMFQVTKSTYEKILKILDEEIKIRARKRGY